MNININIDVGDLYCPITHQIFLNPVVAFDGITYERDAIENWLEKNNHSPVTREVMISKLYHSNILIKNIVQNYLSANPEAKSSQYIESQSKLDKKFFNLKTNDVVMINKLKNMSKCIIKWSAIPPDFFQSIVKMKLLIDKCIDLECRDREGRRPIHYICEFSTPEIIKYIIGKGVNLEAVTRKGWRPIHYICRYSTPEMIKFIIDNNVNLECETKKGWRPIHYICKNSTDEIIRYMIDEKKVELECANSNGWRPIHLICHYQQPETIKFIIQRGVDLECSTNFGLRPIHLICEDSNSELIKFIIERKVNLECETKYKWRPIHYVFENSTPEMMKYMIDMNLNMDCNVCINYNRYDDIVKLVPEVYRNEIELYIAEKKI